MGGPGRSGKASVERDPVPEDTEVGCASWEHRLPGALIHCSRWRALMSGAEQLYKAHSCALLHTVLSTIK